MEQLIVICPHCGDQLMIEELNCCIFRHGIIKNTLEQINPHAVKKECDYLFENNLIYGCGKPFKIVDNKAIICDYI
jgi:hypothetical protein